jgi:hypothetical protein
MNLLEGYLIGFFKISTPDVSKLVDTANSSPDFFDTIFDIFGYL